jgi:hypothetical protein
MSTPSRPPEPLPASSRYQRQVPARLRTLLDTTCCSPRGADLLAGWFAVTVLLGALVVAGNQLLAVSEDLGVMSFLAGGAITEPVLGCDGEPIDAGNQAVAVFECWDNSQKLAVIGLVTLLDSAWAFVYAPFLALLFLRLFSELAADRYGGRCGLGGDAEALDAPATLLASSWMPWVPLIAVLLLFFADLTENVLAGIVALRAQLQAADPLLRILGAVSLLKNFLILVVLVLAGAAFAFWFLGLRATDQRNNDRTRLRNAVERIIWRSRYVLFVLVVFGFLALGMDQSRDVLVGMAQGFDGRAAGLFVLGFVGLVIASLHVATARQRWLLVAVFPVVGVVAVWWPPLRLPLAMLLSVVAVWMFAYACWLWSRILSRLSPPDADTAPRPFDGRDHFAKWWARWLGLIPLLILIALAGLASGDATLAWVAGAHDTEFASFAMDGGKSTRVALFYLALFTCLLALLIQTGFLFDFGREAEDPARAELLRGTEAVKRGLAYYGSEISLLLSPAPSVTTAHPPQERKRSLYYNAVPADGDIASELVQRRYRFPLGLAQAPLTLPLIALAAFELTRALDMTLSGTAPLTLAVIALALTLWTCVLGLLTQDALRHGRPWILLLLVYIGVLGAFGLTDNHRVLTTPYTWSGAGLLWTMLLAQAALALPLALALYWSWKRFVSAHDQQPRWMRGWLAGYGELVERYFSTADVDTRSRLSMKALLGFLIGLAVAAIWLPLLLLKALPTLALELWSSLRAQLGSTDRGNAEPGATADSSAQGVPAAPTSSSGQSAGPTGRVFADWGFFYAIAILVLPMMLAWDWALAPAPLSPDLRAREHSLDAAIKHWVERQPLDGGESLPVYFVSAEGGGIRAAYWAALVLDRLDRAHPGSGGFAERLFSISGVSGGSIGAAVWHVCRRDAASPAVPDLPNACIRDLARANLLTPLLSAWLFEDVLATVIPTSAQLYGIGCKAPGCGFLSRGHLFERSLEAALPPLASPLVERNTAPPYLFLNSTRVEDGQRAIASSVPTPPHAFPSSADQLCVLGPDLPLSTAAHNSARFTYVNAIGAAGVVVPDLGFQERYHLADGGYFDNSGGHTTADIIRAFSRCLYRADNPCGIDEAQRHKAQQRLWPHAIQIRNGVQPSGPDADMALGHAADAGYLCELVPGTEWEDMDLYPDLVGPALTAFNAIGTGANGRVAEAGVCGAARAWHLLRTTALAGATPKRDSPLVTGHDLVAQGVLYPLGWYLSQDARDGMEQAACRAVAIPGRGGRKSARDGAAPCDPAQWRGN